jgi:RNA polymerase sigma-70 factor, ECF subfamily
MQQKSRYKYKNEFLCFSIDCKLTYICIILRLYIYPMSQNSSDIISRVKQGDRKAFEFLFKEYYARLCEYSFLLNKDHEASAEIVQDFFVKLWENRAKLEITNAKSYFFKAIHNNTIKYLHKRNKLEPLKEEFYNGYELQHDFELTDKLEKSLNELPPKCKEIFILSRLDNLRHNEIAAKLGISPKTVEVQIRKANLLLKEKLKEFIPLLFFLLFK